MANDFGALTDHFGILALTHDGGTMADVLELVDSSKVPIAKSRADAQDESGDVAASTYYGNAAGALYTASSTFRLKSGTISLNEFTIGELATGKVVNDVEASTANSQWPEIKFDGILGTPAIQAPTGKEAFATLPDIDIVGAKLAQVMDFTVGAGGRLTGCTFKASATLDQANDGMGEPVAYAISFSPATVSAEFVRVTAQPAWTVSSPLVETSAPSTVEPEAAYHTSSAEGEIPITRDNA